MYILFRFGFILWINKYDSIKVLKFKEVIEIVKCLFVVFIRLMNNDFIIEVVVLFFLNIFNKDK